MRKGLTLIEILVAVILIGISLAVLAALSTSGKHLLKLTENDAQALSLALAKKEELLSLSYQHPDLCPGCQKHGTEDMVFDWNTTVAENSLCNGTDCVPYKEIEVTVEYPEETISGASANKRRSVLVKDIIPYPLIHVESTDSGPSPCSTAVALGCEVGLGWPPTVVAGPLGPEHDLKIDLPAYKVKKDFLVIYDIAINIEDVTSSSGISLEEPDTIWTGIKGYQTNNPSVWAIGSPATETPILSQGSISNIVEFNDVPPNIAHTVEVQWFKFIPGGKISVKKSSLVVIAVEKKE